MRIFNIVTEATITLLSAVTFYIMGTPLGLALLFSLLLSPFIMLNSMDDDTPYIEGIYGTEEDEE